MPDTPRDPPPPKPRAGGVWRVRLLGHVELRSGDVVVSGKLKQAHRLILAPLLLAPRAAHPRLEIARQVWPDSAKSDAALRADLSRRLHELRKLLEPRGFRPAQAIVDEGDSLRLNPAAFDIDVDRFEALVRQRRWQAARDVYGGPLLPGVETLQVQQRRLELASLLDRVDEELEHPAGLLRPEPEEADAPAPEPRGIVAYASDFFGREDEIARLGELVARHRLVVVHGPPGSGKSRTVSEARKTEFGSFEHVFRAALEDCRGSADALDAVRVGAGAQPLKGGPLKAIETRLAGAPALVMLDDFENLAGAAGNALIDLLLAQLPKAHLVVTTRRALRRRDAVLLPHGPLPLPARGDAFEAIAANPAVALFENRAGSVRANFNVNPRNAGVVADICRLLEGMPLALELAGKMLHRLALRALREELERGTRLLRRAVARGERHDSLHLALELSWRLLSPPARKLLGALSVFRGGFTVEQAQVVAGGERVRALLAELARDSLLVTLPSDGGAPRLGLLAPVRAFAEARLTAKEGEALRGRHRALFESVALAQLRRHAWPSTADQANLLAAVGDALAEGEAPRAARIVLALGPWWRARGAGSAELQLIERVAASGALRRRVRALLLAMLAVLKFNAGQKAEADVHAAQALTVAGRDALARAEALLAQAQVSFLSTQKGDPALGLALQAQALLPPALPHAMRLRWLLLRGALALVAEEDVPGATRLAHRADQLCHLLKDERGAQLVLPLRTAALLSGGDLQTALQLCESGAESAAALGLVNLRQQLLNRQALVLVKLERPDDALAVLQRQAREAVEHGATYHAAYAVWNQPEVLAALKRDEEAAVLMGFAHAYWVRKYEDPTRHDEAYVRAVRQAVVGRHDLATWQAWRTRGRLLPEGEGLALACGRRH